MKRIHIFSTLPAIAAIAIAVIQACGSGNSGSGRLSHIDSLLGGGLVDSAYNEICAVEMKELRSTADSAYFFLLRAQAEYRLYKPSSPMESLDFAIHYYSRTRAQQEKLASAYYYKACLLYDAGEIKNAMNFIKNAEFIANKTKNPELRHKIFETLLVINEEAGEDRTALEYSRKSIGESLKAKRTDWLAHAYNNMAALYAKLNKADSSDLYIRKCMELMNSIPEKDSQFILNNIGVYLMKNNPQKAKRYFKQVLATAPLDVAYKNLASIYATEGKTDSAGLMWEKALQTEDMQIKDEVMHSMFSYQLQKGDYAEAARTAEKLIKLKDSLKERRSDNNVKAMQSEFDSIKSRERYERNIMVAIVCITLLALVAIASLLYFRYKQYKTKSAMAHDQMMIKNYENQILELERMGQHKEKEIEAINRRKEKLLDKHRDTLNRGYTLFSEVMAGKPTVLWKKSDFENVIEYYRLVDMEFVDMLDNAFDELSPKYKFFLILEHTGKTDSDIMDIMVIAESSLRSVRSRINKKKK